MAKDKEVLAQPAKDTAIVTEPIKDTAVFVWNTIEANAIPRHFSHLNDEGKVAVFASGKTSHTTTLCEICDNFKIKENNEK